VDEDRSSSGPVKTDHTFGTLSPGHDFKDESKKEGSSNVEGDSFGNGKSFKIVEPRKDEAD